jgi:predicted O-linked N-acetylglucosamine transferase (SPINDLY family)
MVPAKSFQASIAEPLAVLDSARHVDVVSAKSTDPGDEALHRGRSAFQAGRLAEALSLFVSAAKTNAHAASCAGVACQALGRIEEGLAWHRRARELAPDDAFVLNNLGCCLASSGAFAEAAEVLRRAHQADSRDGETLTNLTGALNGLGKYDEALVIGRQAVRCAPGLPQAHNNLGNALIGTGDLDRAGDSYQAALRINPSFLPAHQGLGDVLARRGRLAEAIRLYSELTRLRPSDGTVWDRLAQILTTAGRYPEALQAAREAVRLAPGNAAARNTLGNALVETGELDEAARQFEQALSLRTGWSVPHYNLGICRQRQGRMDEARGAFRKAMAADPADAIAHSTYAGSLFYDPQADAAALLAEHRRWAARHTSSAVALPNTRDDDPERKLRIGYLSPDFRAHAAAFFVHPILTNHDPRRFEVICYAEVPVPDGRTAEFRRLARRWCDTTGLSDGELASRIRADRIDILVDLGGHLAGGRLRALAHKPAPVIVSYLGYPGTTGVAAVDYRLTDAHSDPPGSESGYSERLVRLPRCFCCYSPPTAIPIEPTPPSRIVGAVTFGSLHKLEKLNADVLDLWCELLHAVPDSRLLLARNTLRGATAEYWRGEFLRRGVERTRLLIAAPEPVAMGHMRLYGQIDVALDPFPWGGHTTACEALWMGVPTVTMLGQRYAGRMVASVLRTVGLPELIAETGAEYVRIAATLAADESRRGDMRASLRQQMLASPLCDGKGFVRDLEATYRQLWQRWRQAGISSPNS